MVTRILVPTDGSESAAAALEHALDVAAGRDATVHVLYVADTNEPLLSQLGSDGVDALEREGQAVVADAAELATDRDLSVETHIVRGEPREVIVEFATTGGSDGETDVSVDAAEAASVPFDLVVMGAHGRRGLGEYVLGSVTDYVVNRSEAPVLTVRAADDATHTYPYGDVLVPTDGSVHATAAVKLGASVAARHGATLHLLSVADELPELLDAESAQLPEQFEANLRAVLEEEAATAERAGATDVATAIETGSVPREVVDYAEREGIDLIVMGTHGRTGIDRHLIGSFTERVIRTSPVPVLTTCQPEDAD